MLNKFAGFTVLVMALAVFTGCPVKKYAKRGSYLDGAVSVECRKNHNWQAGDYLTLRFNKSGVYEVSFSLIPDKENRSLAKLPENFTQIVKGSARVITIRQDHLPDWLRITISQGKKMESHDFM